MTLEMTSTFLLSKLKPVLMDNLGIDGLFSMFAGKCYEMLHYELIKEVNPKAYSGEKSIFCPLF